MRHSALLLILLLLLAGCRRPHAWLDDHIEVTGELRADGTCVVNVDGKPAIPDSANARIRMQIEAIKVAGPHEGWGYWMLWCEPATNSPSLLLKTLYRPGHRVGPGTYGVEDDLYDLPRDEEEEPGAWIVGTLYDPPLDPTPEKGYVVHYLVAYEGTLTLTRADTVHPERAPYPTGTFRFVTHREGYGPWW